MLDSAIIGSEIGVVMVHVRDQYGNPLEGLTVELDVAGGGQLSDESVQTNAYGNVEVAWTASLTPGEHRVRAWLADDPSQRDSLATRVRAAAPVMTMGDVHSCALSPRGQAFCWGVAYVTPS